MKFHKFWFGVLGLILISIPLYALADEDQPYNISVVSYRNESKIIVLKYNRYTGTAWILGTNGFQEVPENEAIPFSEYQIEITAILEGWYATRIDMRTGKTWTVDDGQWIAFE